MKQTTICFNVIDLHRTNSNECPLMLSADSTLFNDIKLTQLQGKYYKAVLESNNIVTFYYRDPQLQHRVAHRYAVALNWMQTDDRIAGRYQTPQEINIAERIVYQRLLSMVKLINTSNI